MRTASSTVSAVVVGAIASWELTLLMIFTFPIIVFFGLSNLQLLDNRMKRVRKSIAESSRTAVESISNIRTVVGLGAEEIFFNRYSDCLDETYR